MTLFPLTAFEKYMIIDDHPGYEMVILLEYTFRGRINRDLLVEAFKRVVKYQPLFRATLSRQNDKYYWNVDDQFLIPLIFETTETSVEQSEGTKNVVSISPEKCIGQINILEYCDGVSIGFYVHHTIGDGLGMNQFFASWIKEYDLLLHGQENTEGLNFYPDVSLFERRAESHFVPKEKIPFTTFLYTKFRGIVQWFWRRPLPMLKDTKIDISNLANQYPMYWRRFGPEFFLKYKALAKSKGVSANTLMMRDLYLALRKWIEKYPVDNKSIERQTRWLRVLAPTNIRTDFHRTVPCANIVGYIFVDRRPVECDRSQKFLDSIQEKITTCRKLNSGTTFIKGIHIVNRIPGLMNHLATGNYCHCTTILSSVGNICKSCQQEDYRQNDDISVEHDQYPLHLYRILGAPPNRPHTPISFGVIQRQGEMYLSCRYDLNVMTEQNMLEFYNMFVDEMMKSLETGE